MTAGTLIAGLAVTFGATAADAAEPVLTNQQVETKARCRASAPIVGAVDADQNVTLDMTFPRYVEQGSNFDVVIQSGEVSVPFEESGITLIHLRDIITRTRFSGGFTIVNAEAVAGTGSWRSTPEGTPGEIPGGAVISIDDALHVRSHMVGPFLPGGILVPPSVRVTLEATGAPGTTITSRLAGEIPVGLAPPFPDFGFSITPRVNAPIVGATDAQASCAPNYGPLANGNGELTGTPPFLSETTILPNTNPLVTITAPADGARYLPDAEIFADFACTETVFELVSCESTEPFGTQLDFSTFGVKTFTVTATDANGGVASTTVTYDVGGNITPEVNAGEDQTVNGGELVTLLGSATDPDTGQILSYTWNQVSGPAVVLDPDDANDPFEPNQRFTAPRSGPVDLVFRLRVDDGYGTGEDTVTVHVNANNGPTFTNGAEQTIENVKTNGGVTMNGAATDIEGDTPITYEWTQVDEFGDPLDSEDPLYVALSTPTAVSTSFTAPQGPVSLHFEVEATDSLGAPSVGTVTVNVLANNPPVITNGTNQTLNNIKTSALVQLDGTATDPDNAAPSANHVLSYAWTQVDEFGDPLDSEDPLFVALSNDEIANPTFTSPADPALLRFGVAVSDGYDVTLGTVLVSVVGTEAPIANAGPDQTPGRGRVVTLDGSGSSDPDDDPITYAWTQVDELGDPLDSEDPLFVELSSATAQQPTFTAPVITGAPQAIHFQLIVSDVPYNTASAPDVVTIHLLENQAPVADAGAPQTNKFANNVVTLTGSGSSDIDTGETLTYAWTQVDPDTDEPLDEEDPTEVTLSSASATNPTFSAPHFTESTTLKFKLVVTDLASAVSDPSFTTVQINANRPPAVGAPSATPAVASRTVGATVTVTVPASAADLDGDPVSGFAYQWVQTDSAGDPCAPGCAIADVTLTPVGGTPRSATFTAPAFTAAGATLFFRLTVNDGFGATAQSTNLTVALANSAPVVRWAVRPLNMAATADTANATTSNRVYAGQLVELDPTENPAQTLSTVDPDGTTVFTYDWRQVTTATGTTLVNCGTVVGGCVLGAQTSNVQKPTFTMPAPTARPFLRLTVTDQFGTNAAVVVFQLNSLANTLPTVSATGPAFVEGGTEGVELTGTATDPQTAATPAQTLTYEWTQVDGSGDPLSEEDDLYVTLSDADTLTPTFDAPELAGTLHFKLSVTDGAATVSATHSILVAAAGNLAPIANAGEDQSGIAAGALVELDGSGSSDPEGHPFTYQWTEVDEFGDPVLPTVTLSSNLAQKPTFTAPGTGPLTLHFRLVVTDQFEAVSAPDFVEISVDANGVPTANAGEDQSGIAAGQPVELDGSGSGDPENHTLTYQWTQVDEFGDPITPTVVLSSNSAQKPTFTAPNNGTLHFRLVVSDPYDASAPDFVEISIDANAAPIANAGEDQSGLAAGALVELDGSGSFDPEDHTLTYEWTEVDEFGDPVTPTVTLSSDSAQKPTFTAPGTGPLTLHFRLVVTDQFDAVSAPDFVEISVDANGVPTANAGENQSGIAASALVELDGSGSSDPENQTLTYAWTEVDEFGDPITTVTLSSDSAQKPTFTAPVTGPLTLRFRLVVTDQFGAVSDFDEVEVAIEANQAPISNAGPDQSGIASGQIVTLDGSGSSDPENHTIDYEWTQVDALGNPITPTVVLSSNSAQQPTFTAPATPTGATLRFRLVVTDQHGAISTADFVLVSIGFNSRPIADAGPDQTPGRGALVTLDASGSSDPNGDDIEYAWVQMNGFSPILPSHPLAVTLSSNSAQKPTFTAPVAVGNLSFWLFVTDEHGALSDPDVVIVHLVDNNAPTANAGVAQTNRVTNSTVTLNGSASSDLDNDPLEYEWAQVDPETDDLLDPEDPTFVTLSDASATSPTFVAPHFAASTTLKFRLVVTDTPFGAESAPSFTTVQVNANRAPTLGAPTATPAAGSRTRGTTVTIQIPAPANDADGDPNTGFTYQWMQTDNTGVPCAPGCAVADVTINNADQRIATFTAPDFTVASATLFFRLTVDDGFGASAQSSNLTVALANTAPIVPNPPSLRTGFDMSVLNPTTIYIGAQIEIDATSIDPDGITPLDYTFSGQPCGGLGEALGCLFASGASGYPGGSCRGITITQDEENPGIARFTAPPFGPSNQNPNVCGLRVVVTDGVGGSVTRNWSYALKANVGGPVAGISPLPAKVLATTTAADGIVALSGSPTTDPDTAPTQPIGFTWEQVDPITGDPVPVGSPSRGEFSNPNAMNTTWKAPTTAPHAVRFQLTATDGITFPGVALSSIVNVTTQAPGADAGPDRLTNPGRVVELDGSGSFDAGNRPLTYSWQQLSGPEVTLQNPFAAEASFTAPYIPLGGATQIFEFELTTRNGLAASFDTVTVVNEPWAAPTANAGEDQTVGETGVVQLDGTGSSTPAGTALTYEWEQVGGPTATLSSPTSATPTFTPPNISYAGGPQDLTFELVVNDGFGDSAADTVVITVNPNPDAPAAPLEVVAVGGNAQATVTITPGSDNGSPVLVYVAQCVSSNGGVTRTALGGATVVVPNLTNGGMYTCRAYAFNAVGAGPLSAPTPSFRVAAPPGTPTGVTAVTGNGTAVVNFTPGPNGGEPFVIYAVVCESSNGGATGGGYFGPGPATIGGLTNGKTYACRVIAAHVLGASDWSAYSTPFVAGAPAAPPSASALPGSATATVSWTAPATNGAAITGYTVTPYIGTTAQPSTTFGSPATSQIITGLTNGVTYTFRVAAINARGTGVHTTTGAVTVGAPLAPTSVTANGISGGRAQVSWGVSANTNGAAVTSYVIIPVRAGVDQTPIAHAGTTRNRTITGLTPGVSYTFKVAAVNSRGTGPQSNQSNAVIPGV